MSMVHSRRSGAETRVMPGGRVPWSCGREDVRREFGFRGGWLVGLLPLRVPFAAACCSCPPCWVVGVVSNA